MSWSKVYESTIYRADDRSSFLPILLSGFQGDRLAIMATSATAKPSWWLGFRLIVLAEVDDFPTGAIVAEYLRRNVPLNRNFLLDVAVPAYDLRLEIPYWHEQITIIIWQGLAGQGLAGEADQPIVKGQLLYLKLNSHLDLAQADAIATAAVIGLALSNAATATSVNYATDGYIDQDDWSAVTGSPTLAPGALYFLSATTAGQLTTTAPTLPGQVVIEVGRAVSSKRLAIEIQPPILL